MPEVHLLNATENPEKLVCSAARNDYTTNGVATVPFEGLMNSVEGSDLESKQEELLKHLIKQGHWGVFEHPQATIELNGVTRVAMAQITRHRHFSFDIMSLRYVQIDGDDVEGTFSVPKCVKEGEAISRTDGVSEIDPKAEELFIEAYEDSIESYRNLIDLGVPQEEARKVLPMGTKVNIVMSGNARAWLHLLNIRGKANVQREARDLSDQIFKELSDWMPETMELYDDQLPMELAP